MELTKKTSVIFSICIVMIVCFSVYILYKNLRPSKGLPYEQISMEQAVEYMEYGSEYVLLDVRDQEEFAEGHIPGAICIPVGEIKGSVEDTLKEKEQMIYVYCRSGNRSKTAAKVLCDMGYTNVTEIGGIIDWPGEIET